MVAVGEIKPAVARFCIVKNHPQTRMVTGLSLKCEGWFLSNLLAYVFAKPVVMFKNTLHCPSLNFY